MKLRDKKAWLEAHGHAFQYYAQDHGYNDPRVIVVQWSSSTSIIVRAEGDTEKEAWDNLFTEVAETLYTMMESMINKP